MPAASGLLTTLPSSPKILWKKQIGDGLASPVTAGKLVVYLDNQDGKETVHAVEQETGKSRWSVALDETFKDTQSAAGPRSTPLIDGDRVYAQSCRGELQCLTIETGQVRWRKNYVKDFGAVFVGEKGLAAGASRHGYNAAPVIYKNFLLALAGGTNGSAVVALDKISGEVKWQSGNDPAAYAAPILSTLSGKTQLIAFAVPSLFGLDADNGKLLWRLPYSTTFGRHATTPVVIGDQVLVASHEFGLVAAKISGTAGSLDAHESWRNKEAAINFSSPVAIGEYLYGVGPSKNLVCVAADTGKIMWSQEGYFTSAPGKAHAGFLVMGKRLLILTDGGELLLIDGNPRQFQELGRVQVCGVNWCNPAYADGRLYLRDSDELMCVDLR